MSELIRILNELNNSPNSKLPDDKMEIVELCVASIKQLANTKQTFREFLGFSSVNRDLLTECLERVFKISDRWYECTTELLRFKKILGADSDTPVT